MLAHMVEHYSKIPIILMTAFSSVEGAVDAMIRKWPGTRSGSGSRMPVRDRGDRRRFPEPSDPAPERDRHPPPDSGQRVADLVGDPASKLSNCCEPLLADQLVLECCQFVVVAAAAPEHHRRDTNRNQDPRTDAPDDVQAMDEGLRVFRPVDVLEEIPSQQQRAGSDEGNDRDPAEGQCSILVTE